MPFQKGNKHSKGGKRKGAGRHTREKAEINKKAAEIAREFIEKNIQPVLDTYLDNAKGHWETRYTEGKNPKEFKVWVVDAPTTRHWIDKFVPEAPKTVKIDAEVSFDDLLVKVAQRKRSSDGSRDR